VSVKPEDLIAPLYSLAYRDPTIARILYSTLFLAIYEKIPPVRRCSSPIA
jgi:hypothetical protein